MRELISKVVIERVEVKLLRFMQRCNNGRCRLVFSSNSYWRADSSPLPLAKCRCCCLFCQLLFFIIIIIFLIRNAYLVVSERTRVKIKEWKKKIFKKAKKGPFEYVFVRAHVGQPSPVSEASLFLFFNPHYYRFPSSINFLIVPLSWFCPSNHTTIRSYMEYS